MLLPMAWPLPLSYSLCFWLYYERIMAAEEEFLEQRFGQAWLEYKKRVPRYLGRIKS